MEVPQDLQEDLPSLVSSGVVSAFAISRRSPLGAFRVALGACVGPLETVLAMVDVEQVVQRAARLERGEGCFLAASTVSERPD